MCCFRLGTEFGRFRVASYLGTEGFGKTLTESRNSPFLLHTGKLRLSAAFTCGSLTVKADVELA
jgi:hypothetical protein